MLSRVSSKDLRARLDSPTLLIVHGGVKCSPSRAVLHATPELRVLLGPDIGVLLLNGTDEGIEKTGLPIREFPSCFGTLGDGKIQRLGTSRGTSAAHLHRAIMRFLRRCDYCTSPITVRIPLSSASSSRREPVGPSLPGVSESDDE
jgi:hypothetical protein